MHIWTVYNLLLHKETWQILVNKPGISGNRLPMCLFLLNLVYDRDANLTVLHKQEAVTRALQHDS